MLKKLTFTVASVMALLAASPASAAAIVVGQWYTFGFQGLGSTLVGGAGFSDGTNPASISAPDGPWTFTLDGSGAITIVDAFLSGDQFSLSDSGTNIGVTSAPIANANCGNNITTCLASASQSKGTFALGSGNHSISGTLVASAGQSGAGYFRVAALTGAVPEPGTWAMMLLGFGLVGASMRRRKPVAVRFA